MNVKEWQKHHHFVTINLVKSGKDQWSMLKPLAEKVAGEQDIIKFQIITLQSTNWLQMEKCTFTTI